MAETNTLSDTAQDATAISALLTAAELLDRLIDEISNKKA